MKRIFKRILIFLGISLILLFLVIENLKTNSVYYAKNMPRGEGQHPEWIMLIENLDAIIKPDIDGIEYKIDGTRVVINYNNNYESFGNSYDEEIEYIYSDGKATSYAFNKNFRLLHAIDFNEYKSIDISKVNKEEIIAKIDKLLSPIVNTQSEPLIINLQWLFNLIYQNQFK